MGFWFYIQEGIGHILDFQGIDHMLFVLTLACVYTLSDFKKVLILLTAFTIGHSLTLILSGLNIVRFPQEFIETLIPITIIVAGLYNLLSVNKKTKGAKVKYAMAAFFGLIHGAGFSNYFKMMLADIEDSLLLPLFGFNLGIELGQIIIVSLYFVALWLLMFLAKVALKDVTKVVSGIAIYESLCILFL